MLVARRSLCLTTLAPYLSILLLATYICSAFSIPHSTSVRRTSFATLQLPNCALTCFINTVLTDGCANESDFACHCEIGNIIDKTSACIAQGCNAVDGADGTEKIKVACRAIGFGVATSGVGLSSNIRTGSSTKASSIVTGMVPSTTTMTTTNIQASAMPSNTSIMGSTTGVLEPTGSLTSGSPPPAPAPTNNSPLPTDMPLALLPVSAKLSDGAKVGISVSILFLAFCVFFALGWYIRRLKCELRASQQAASGVPDDVWRSNIAVPVAPGGLGRASSRRGRRLSRDEEALVSPLSPRNMEEIMTVTDNGYGVLKKKRGNVLSIVVEREEDEQSSVSRSTREPVAGQREGLTGPLELDGGFTGLFEMPISVTPRSGSIER